MVQLPEGKGRGVINLDTFHIHIKGRVQGVGFRPKIYRLARKMHINGTVSNTTDGVHIYLNASRTILEDFIRKIKNSAPVIAVVESIGIEKIPDWVYKEFSIVESEETGKPDMLITHDFGICEDCLREMRDPENRRLAYPFITCTHCGPRYSVITDLPYDRPMTTMNAFGMCVVCKNEY